MSTINYICYLSIMAITTYLIRALPFAIVKKEIQNPYIKSFLNYIPYTVLAAMTFPAILYSTSSILSAIAGLFVAAIFAYMRKSMVKVAIAACTTVYLVELLLKTVPIL